MAVDEGMEVKVGLQQGSLLLPHALCKGLPAEGLQGLLMRPFSPSQALNKTVHGPARAAELLQQPIGEWVCDDFLG